MTDIYKLFGNPIKHSQSPLIHKQFAEQTQQDLIYEKQCIPKDSFKEAVLGGREQKIKGINITLPFKEQAYELCDVCSIRGEQAGAINTIKFLDDGRIYGDNTDGCGLIRDIKVNIKFNMTNKTILVMGAGGAARGALKPLADEKPTLIVIVNRTRSKAEALAKRFSKYANVVPASYAELVKYQFDLIINSTSASLQSETLPLPENILSENSCCYDMVYSKEPTKFMKWALEQRCTLIFDGLGMLIEQAAEAFYLWRDIRPETINVIKHIRQII